LDVILHAFTHTYALLGMEESTSINKNGKYIYV